MTQKIMGEFGKFVIISGILLIVVGVFMSLGSKIPFVGKLPGDLYYHKDGFTFYFPIVTSILLSIILSLVLNFFFRR